VINRRSYCKTIAHRGYSNIAPENTIPAYKMAGKYGFYGAETDVYETKDGYYILMHDETVDRTTTGSGLISELTLAQIKELIVDFGANVSKYPELRVPTLEEFFIVCKEYGIVPVIEIKNINNPSVFIDLIKKYGLEDKCMIIS
ncbi:glycerophosphodiester phosphodiesterase, partial [Clostridium saudiense]|nr:glycerophosphodiester phosphodiesterase [Clostridium saudiense]